MELNSVTFVNEPPEIADYQKLYSTTDWVGVPDLVAATALLNSILFISAYYKEQLIGMVRIVGDRAMYYYVQDMVVHPDFQRKNIGTALMQQVMEFIDNKIHKNAFVGLMAAADAEPFYQKFGFSKRKEGEAGMYLDKS